MMVHIGGEHYVQMTKQEAIDYICQNHNVISAAQSPLTDEQEVDIREEFTEKDLSLFEIIGTTLG